MSTPKSAAAPQYNRACDPCRMHKVRCIPDADSGANAKVCQRCARTDRKCVFTTPQKRKQRKRTDTRVAELEREVQAMRALFQNGKEMEGGNSAKKAQRSSSDDATTPVMNRGGSSSMTGKTWIPKATATYSTPGSQSVSQQSSAALETPAGDVIDRGILSMELALQLYDTYVKDLAPQYPAVILSPGHAVELRSKRPTLFLAVIAAAAGKTDPHLYSILNSEVLSNYARQMVMSCGKSLELVQSLIVTTVWYYPPGKFAQLKFYEYIHMAATMALDIGIGSNPMIERNRRTPDQSPASDAPDPAEIERRRTFLAC